MKTFVKNRKGQKVCVVVEGESNPKGLVFIMHGLSGNKDQEHIRTFTQAFLDNGYTAVSFDTTNTFGESDGLYEEATTTNYYEDLEDIISWASGQPWYHEPFVLVGHSLGGICVALYAEAHPNKIKALAPISTVVSGKLSEENKISKGKKSELEDWKKTGWRTETSANRPGLIKRLKWAHMEDRLKYNLLPKADKLTMPVLMIVGNQDNSTPQDHQKILYDVLPGKKELHIIKNAPHTFKNLEHLVEIKNIFTNWINSL